MSARIAPVKDSLENAVDHTERDEASAERDPEAADEGNQVRRCNSSEAGVDAAKAGSAAALASSPNSSNQTSTASSSNEGPSPSNSRGGSEPRGQQAHQSGCNGVCGVKTAKSATSSTLEKTFKGTRRASLGRNEAPLALPQTFSKDDLKPKGWDRLVIHPDNRFKVCDWIVPHPRHRGVPSARLRHAHTLAPAARRARLKSSSSFVSSTLRLSSL